MSTMTIITFGRRLIAQFRNFTVNRLEIGLGYFLVTATALIHNLEFKAGLIGSSDDMRLVTIVTIGEFFFRAAVFFGMNAAYKLLVNAAMTPGAGAGDIFSIHARRRIIGRKDMMRGMAIGTHGRDNQT